MSLWVGVTVEGTLRNELKGSGRRVTDMMSTSADVMSVTVVDTKTEVVDDLRTRVYLPK